MPRSRFNTRRAIAITLFSAWVLCLVMGFQRLTSYAAAPGVVGRAASDWPAESMLPAPQGRPVLVLAVHPKCPCSRATASELARIAAKVAGEVDLHALVTVPTGAGDDFTDTLTCQSLATVPGLKLHRDRDGIEAARFAGLTSGSVAVYSAAGELLYTGGITRSRGHEGDNDGKAAVVEAIRSGKATPAYPVYGCSLE